MSSRLLTVVAREVGTNPSKACIGFSGFYSNSAWSDVSVFAGTAGRRLVEAAPGAMGPWRLLTFAWKPNYLSDEFLTTVL